MVQRLRDKAWDVTVAINHTQLKQYDGLSYLLKFLENMLCRTAIPDVGARLEEMFLKL